MASICLDAGTTTIKAVAFDDNGTELQVAREPTKVSRPRPGHSEQDMNEVWDAVVHTIRTVHRELGGDDVDMIAFTGQGDGCWLVDRQGNPTGPAMLWNDARAAAVADEWERSGVSQQAFRINGSLSFAGLPNAILAWLKRHDPERLERSHKALKGDGWIFSRLTGVLADDVSDMSVPLLDIRNRQFSPELLRLYGIEWAERLLPDILQDDQRVGRLSEEAASQLGLPAGLPVVIASYDIAATAVGVGAVAAGQSCSILGTTLCTEVVVDHVNTDAEPSGFTIAFGVPGHELRAYPTLAGTEVVTWTLKLLGLTDPRQLSELAAKVAPGAFGLSFMPYLSPAGERAPFLDSNARGSLMGLSFEHDREHVARAVLEGLTLVIKDCLAATDTTPTQLGVCGGGANSDFWVQMIADVTGVPTFRSADTEVGAKGAFITGLVATGAEPDFAQAASRYAKVRDTFEPDEQTASAYDEVFHDFLELRGTAGQAWPRLAAARARSAAG
jgi:erythritol kinase (D-erythritol 1-phosphate-forming)